MTDEPTFATPEERRAYYDGKLTEAEMAELLDLMSACTGIGIKAPDVTITFDDIFTAGKFFDRLHKAIRRIKWDEVVEEKMEQGDGV